MRTRRLPVLLSAFLVLTAAAAELGPATLVCHRGERSGGAADNSLAAFTRAVTCAMSFECDVRMDEEGRVCCSHDKLTNGTSCPTYFREVLPLARNGRWIVVDVKGEKDGFREIAEAMQKDLAGQSVATPANLFFICYDLDLVREVRRALPDYKTMWLTGCALRGDFPEEAMSADEMIVRTREAGANGVDLSDRPEVFTKEFVGRLFAAGLEVHMCTRGELPLVEDAFRRGALTVTPLVRAREILEEASPIPPEVVWVDAGRQLWNVRDIGWTGLGRGRIYRGSAWESSDGRADEGTVAAYVTRLGIRTDIDLRSEGERARPTNVRPSAYGVRDAWHPVPAYLGLWEDPSGYAAVLRELVPCENYPVYIHCAGGADRTGTVAFLIEALCGVDETTICKDFEATNRYGLKYGYRSANTAGSTPFRPMLERFRREFAGETLQAKAEDCCRRLLKLTPEEIATIRKNLKREGGTK